MKKEGEVHVQQVHPWPRRCLPAQTDQCAPSTAPEYRTVCTAAPECCTTRSPAASGAAGKNPAAPFFKIAAGKAAAPGTGAGGYPGPFDRPSAAHRQRRGYADHFDHRGGFFSALAANPLTPLKKTLRRSSKQRNVFSFFSPVFVVFILHPWQPRRPEAPGPQWDLPHCFRCRRFPRLQ